MDKKMKKVTKKIQTAEGFLRNAEKQNKKLTAQDKKRDKKIEMCEKRK